MNEALSWRQVKKRCLGGAAGWVRELRQGFTIYRENSPASLQALEALLPDPDLLLGQGEVFKPGSRGFAVKVEIGGRSYFLKAYNCLGWGYRLRNALRRSRALRTWCVNWGFLFRGVPVPRPVLCLEERRFRLLGRSYLLTEFAEGSCNLQQAWATRSGDACVSLLGRVTAVLGDMHRRGCVHGDLKWNNILVAGTAGDEEICLVDLDGGRLPARARFASLRKDLERFLRDLRKERSGLELEAAAEAAWRGRVQ
ncbi:hypothetical protein DESUT3_22620 [Desulfuromonas versatilis]|uniref:Non-specific serine/threonine protein kinase n=1 Tax=Desulfuromonas versatilis TaxID=2802975 RepID=A0ABM8HVR2_9BACT|nr:lipopolysaccharide kinase InaA family protein [Desulfuromonas versatilis]BCR05193.1 hypothetical protein DESUT3_22620 [Desulfuromonas versatilis]